MSTELKLQRVQEGTVLSDGYVYIPTFSRPGFVDRRQSSDMNLVRRITSLPLSQETEMILLWGRVHLGSRQISPVHLAYTFENAAGVLTVQCHDTSAIGFDRSGRCFPYYDQIPIEDSFTSVIDRLQHICPLACHIFYDSWDEIKNVTSLTADKLTVMLAALKSKNVETL